MLFPFLNIVGDIERREVNFAVTFEINAADLCKFEFVIAQS